VIELHGRRYPLPARRLAAICLDGADPAYFDDPELSIPTLRGFAARAGFAIARGVIPSFTNPNNVSIVTGAPPAAHGITGNHFFDPERGAEVAMNARAFRNGPTLLEALDAAGRRTTAVTAKKKLLELLGDVARTSSEAPRPIDLELAGPPADIYDPAASIWVLELGAALLERDLADVVYLSTTDYVFHKHGPRTAPARAFLAAVDRAVARLAATGAIVGLTADHGMNDKSGPSGPRVLYLEPLLPGARVLLPITDAYVVHHAALGSMATVYTGDLSAARAALLGQPGIERVLDRAEAAAELELDPSRIGDLVVLADRGTVLGKSAERHELSALDSALRSHGGLHEQAVPIFANVPVPAGPLRNFDLFAVLLGAPGFHAERPAVV